MERLSELFRLYYNKTATPEQTLELMQLINSSSDDQLKSLIQESGENLELMEYSLLPDKITLILNHILQQKQPLLKKINWWRYAAVASVIFLLSLGSFFFLFHKTTVQQTVSRQKLPADVHPGSYKAKLTLSDGTTIVLDSAALGVLARQGNTSVINKEGQLLYDSKGSGGKVLFNTVSTSNGESYSFTMADGSIISLNTSSSVKFPVAFPGAERRMEITGEAYFKVAKNARQPFIVSVKGMEVQALGTEFNINAYPDETSMNTTLIKGSVKVMNHEPGVVVKKEVFIKPGQQTQLKENQLSVISNVNTDEVIAWKGGFFHFENADLKTILRQFARWYNIEVIYEAPVSNETYFSIMSRNTSLSNVLKSLQANDIKFRIEGKKLYVRKG